MRTSAPCRGRPSTPRTFPSMPEACAGVLGAKANAAATRKLLTTVRYSIVKSTYPKLVGHANSICFRWRAASPREKADLRIMRQDQPLGDKAAALAKSERAIASNPIEKGAVDGPVPIEILARIAAQIGEPDRAIAPIQKPLSIPYQGAPASNAPLTPALFRLDPMFDPLRNDPRFQKRVASEAPQAADK